MVHNIREILTFFQILFIGGDSYVFTYFFSNNIIGVNRDIFILRFRLNNLERNMIVKYWMSHRKKENKLVRITFLYFFDYINNSILCTDLNHDLQLAELLYKKDIHYRLKIKLTMNFFLCK